MGGATKQVFVGNWTEIVQGCQFIRLCAYDPRHLSYTILHYLATTCKNSLRVQLKLCISCNRRFYIEGLHIIINNTDSWAVFSIMF